MRSHNISGPLLSLQGQADLDDAGASRWRRERGGMFGQLSELGCECESVWGVCGLCVEMDSLESEHLCVGMVIGKLVGWGCGGFQA